MRNFRLKILFLFLLFLAGPSAIVEARIAGCEYDYAILTLDPKEREMQLAVLKEYRTAGSAFKNENLKHVRRMVKRIRGAREELAAAGIDASALEMAIYISDMAKSPHIIQKFMHKYGDDFFKTFLDHSKISMQLANSLRRELGIPNDRWQKIVKGVIGHDGPSTPGSFWGNTYSAMLGKEYADLVSPEGVIHAILDRIDQGGLFKQANGQLDGGMRKISYDVMNGIAPTPHAGNLAATIRHTFENVHKATYPQLDELDNEIIPRFFPKGVPNFIRELRQEFKESYDYLSRVVIDDANPDTVFVVMDSGERLPANNLDEFWQLLSRVNLDSPPVARVRTGNPVQDLAAIARNVGQQRPELVAAFMRELETSPGLAQFRGLSAEGGPDGIGQIIKANDPALAGKFAGMLKHLEAKHGSANISISSPADLEAAILERPDLAPLYVFAVHYLSQTKQAFNSIRGVRVMSASEVRGMSPMQAENWNHMRQRMVEGAFYVYLGANGIMQVVYSDDGEGN